MTFIILTDRPGYKSSLYSTKDSSPLKSAYSPANKRKDTYRPSYQQSNQSSDDRPPSPSGRSDISESTTVLMAGFEAYKPISRSGRVAVIYLQLICVFVGFITI